MALTPEQKTAEKARRLLAKQIKAGTYQPSKIGAKAREIASERLNPVRPGGTPRADLINEIVDLKILVDGDEMGRRTMREVVNADPKSGIRRSQKHLKQILARYRAAVSRNWSPKHLWDQAQDFFGDSFDDVKSAFYYH